MNKEYIIGIFGAAAGAIVVEFIRLFKRKEEITADEAKAIRRELREECQKLRTELNAVSRQLDEARRRWYELQDENVELRKRCLQLEAEVKSLRSAIQGDQSIP